MYNSLVNLKFINMNNNLSLPKVSNKDVMDFMEADTISRLHLGMGPLPYIWYKKSLQMIKCGMYKYMDSRKYDIILAYCMASRKQRRENPFFRKCYLSSMQVMALKAETDKLTKKLDKMIKHEKSRMLR